MHRFYFLISIFILGTLPALAKSSDTAAATYIMQLSSNLNCDMIDIAFVSEKDGTQKHIKFGSGAFAATQLPAGNYSFGDITCVNEDKTQTFDVLSKILKPVNIKSGKTYYAGRMIFQEVSATDANGIPEVLDNCTRVMSRARGETSNECRDGAGVDTSAKNAKQLNVYVPDVTDEDIARVRKALSATPEQLQYLPLKV